MAWKQIDGSVVAYNLVQSGITVFGAAALVLRHGEPTDDELQCAAILEEVAEQIDKRVLLRPEENTGRQCAASR